MRLIKIYLGERIVNDLQIIRNIKNWLKTSHLTQFPGENYEADR